MATQSDYEKYADTHRIMLMFFKRELISSTFLFIGYSFYRSSGIGLLERNHKIFGILSNIHYTIMKNNPKDPYFKHFVEILNNVIIFVFF